MNYGPMMIDLEGSSINAKERILLEHPSLGGIILFSKNFSSLESLVSLIAEIRDTAKNPLLIAVDHEGGRVWRFKEGFTVLPPAEQYGKLYQSDPQAARMQAKNAGLIMAAELLDVGIDFSLAPVLDINHGISEVIGDRAFHADPKLVSELAKAFIEGMNEVGMQATGKHFPGHGGSAQDSHFAEAVDDRTLDQLLQKDLVPFATLASYLGAVMPAHVLYPQVDSLPCGYSKIWLQKILRESLKFTGAVISDCLSMKSAHAAGGDFVLRARMAIDAGCDLVILCNQERDLLKWVFDKLDRKLDMAAHKRLSAMAGNFQNVTRMNTRPKLIAIN